jgi:hypothetical protein
MPQDVQQALRGLNRQALETLATPLTSIGDWSAVVVGDILLQELVALEARCRGRESLRDQAGSAFRHTLNRGVRAMFGGPSGTGKTLASRALAGALDLDIYRVDLSAVVNKYIGETERNLDVVARREGWAEVPAVKNGLIFPVTEAFLGRPGPRLVEGYRALARICASTAGSPATFSR